MQYIEQKDGRKIDLLICCGDFQAVRNLDDLECMACPPKYRHLATFHKYYSGEKIAPYPTLFSTFHPTSFLLLLIHLNNTCYTPSLHTLHTVGGNHEAINYLWELYHGGYVAPNIYFLGYAGVVNFGGLRIAGLSGIYKGHHFEMGHFEEPPYSESTMRSAYHVRSIEVHRLLRLQSSVSSPHVKDIHPIDIFLSHDWPSGIVNYGNIDELLKRKNFLRQEIADGSLGSPPAAQILHVLQPRYWFSAHLHTKYAAVIDHQDSGRQTRFLSLDKCLPGREFLQILDIPIQQRHTHDQVHPGITTTTTTTSASHTTPTIPLQFMYDVEWLAILSATHQFTSLLARPQRPLPSPQPVSEDQMNEIKRAILDKNGNSTVIPANFQRTAPVCKDDSEGGPRRGRMPRTALRNPQTEALFRLLDVPYNLHSDGKESYMRYVNPEEINLDDVDSYDELNDKCTAVDVGKRQRNNPEEIDLDDDIDDDEREVHPALHAVIIQGQGQQET